MNIDFSGKIALVTGAAQGIGKAAAMIFAKYGCKVACIDIKAEAIESTAKEIKAFGGDAFPIIADVSRRENVYESVNKVVEHFGRIDFLVNCAGIINADKITDIEDDVWYKVMNVNANSVYLYSKAVAKQMIEKGIKGKIVSISSCAAKLGEYGNGAYSCSKAVVSALTQVLGLELAEYGINVNAICPGPTNTQMMQNVFIERAPLVGMGVEEYEKDWKRNVPLKRLADPNEMAEILAFLCSEYASFMTAAPITVSGGFIVI